MKLYVVSDTEKGTDNIEGVYYLMAETGELLYSHWCSDKHFAKGDLIADRPKRIQECKSKYGDYEVLHLGEDGVTKAELLAFKVDDRVKILNDKGKVIGEGTIADINGRRDPNCRYAINVDSLEVDFFDEYFAFVGKRNLVKIGEE